jgi:hypothetical protein
MDDTDHALFPRFFAELVATALKDTPVVTVTGPRQCGKTTLVRDLHLPVIWPMGRPSDLIARNMKRFRQRPPLVPLPRADVSDVSAGTTGKRI